MAVSSYPEPYIKKARLEIDGVMYDHHVRNVRIVQPRVTNWWKPISGEYRANGQPGDRTVTFEYGQDMLDANGLMKFLADNEGLESAQLKFIPDGTDGTMCWRVRIYDVHPGDVGGAEGVAVSTVTHACSRPTWEAWTEPV